MLQSTITSGSKFEGQASYV